MRKVISYVCMLFLIGLSCSLDQLSASEHGSFFIKSPLHHRDIGELQQSTAKYAGKSNYTPDLTTYWEKKSMQTFAGKSHMTHFIWEGSRPPYGQWDKIILHRLIKRSTWNERDRNKVILLLPGTWNAAGWSDLIDTSINTIYYLANQGYDVYTLSFRNGAIPNLEYEQFPEYGFDVSQTLDWTYGLYREDIKACIEKIKRLSKTRKVFLAGFSRGVQLAFIYASKYQNDLKGLVALDGPVKKYPPNTDEAVDQESFNFVIYLLQNGLLPVPDDCDGILCPPAGTNYQLLNEATWEHYNSWQLAAVVPFAMTLAGSELPAEFFTISSFIADNGYSMWGDGVFSNYYGGNINEEVLVTAMSEFTRFWPTIQDFEQWQLEAYDDVPYFDYDDNQVNLPLIAFLSPLFCPNASCTDPSIPNLTIHPDVTINYLSAYGHIDIMFGNNSMTDIKEPLLNWLNSHLHY